MEEDRVHRLPDVIIASEREGQIAQSSADLCSRQILVNPLRRPYEIKGVGIVFPHSGSHSQHIRVKNNVVRIEPGLSDKQTVGTGANLNPSFKRVRLAFLVKSHHHKCGPQFPHPDSPFQEHILTLLERQGIDN